MTAHTLFVCNGGSVIFILPIERTEKPYLIANPTIMGRMSDQELTQLFSGYGWKPYFVEGEDPNPTHQLNYPHHHPQFDFDEDALPIGAGLLATAIADFVLPE